MEIPENLDNSFNTSINSNDKAFDAYKAKEKVS